MQFSNDEQHAATLDFLAEVRDYLVRWPPHPMNREMIQKIEAHLAEPAHKLVKAQSYTRAGAAHTPVGQCILGVSLTGSVATVSMPMPTSRVAVPEKAVLAALRRGQEVELKLVESDERARLFDRFWPQSNH